MELFAYAILLAGSIFIAFFYKNNESPPKFHIVYLLHVLFLFLIVRLKYDADINVYAASMRVIIFDFYYLREPIIWFGQSILYLFFRSEYAVFLIFDLVAAYILYCSFRNLKAPKYSYLSIFLFFPFVLGMQNIYRQWFSSILFLYAYSVFFGDYVEPSSKMLNDSRKSYKINLKSFIFLIFSVGTHNVAAIFYPILLSSRGKILFYISSLTIPFLIYLGRDGKTDAETGANLSGAYIFLLLFLLVAFFILDIKNFIIKRKFINNYKIFLFIICTSIFALSFTSSVVVERIVMFALVFVYPIVALKIDSKFNNKFLPRFLFIILGFLPIFSFETRVFLF